MAAERFVSENPFRILCVGSEVGPQDLRKKATSFAIKSKAGISEPPPLAERFGYGDAETLPSLVSSLAHDSQKRTAYRILWPLNELGLSYLVAGGGNVPRGTLSDTDVAQLQFLVAWFAFLDSRVVQDLSDALALWQDLYNNEDMDNRLVALLETEENLDSAEAFDVLIAAQSTVERHLLTHAALEAVARWESGDTGIAIQLIAALLESPVNDESVDIAIKPIVELGGRLERKVAALCQQPLEGQSGKSVAAPREVAQLERLVSALGDRNPASSGWAISIAEWYSAVALRFAHRSCSNRRSAGVSGALREARRLLELNACPVPIPHGQKHPAIAWKRFQAARPTRDELDELFHGGGGVGVVCGAVSSNLTVLDFDNSDAYLFWRKHSPEAANGLPTDCRNGRYHVYCRLPVAARSGKLFIRGFEGPAGDLLGEGKLCVCPPTEHPDGGQRRWVVEPTDGFPMVTLDLLGVEVRPEPKRTYEAPPPGTTAGTRPGDEYNARGTWPELLERHGWKYAGRCGRYHGWTRPGKDVGVSAATGLGSKGQDLLYVFSSNAEPLEADTCYSKFSALATLEHGGDFSAATRALVHKGFGQPGGSSSLRAAGSDEVGAGDVHHHYVPPLGDDEPTSAEDELFGSLFKSLPDYLREAGDGEPQWVVEGLLPASYLVIIGGNSKSGKSTLATALGLAVACGEPFVGLTTCGGSVLWCAYEESEQERTMVLREFPSHPAGFHITHHKLLIDTPEGLAGLRYWILRTGARLLVIDPLYGANQAESLSDGRTARAVLAGLKDLCRETGVCCLVLHHITKNTGAGMVRERMADSNQILATASMDLLMEVTENGDSSRTVRLVGHGRGTFANQTWVLRSTSVSGWELVAHGADAEVDAEYRDGQLLEAVRVTPEGLTAVQMAERTGLNEGTVRNRLTVMVRDGRLVTVGKDGRANRYGPGPKCVTQTWAVGGDSTFDPV